jgi:hypothetical protein
MCVQADVGTPAGDGGAQSFSPRWQLSTKIWHLSPSKPKGQVQLKLSIESEHAAPFMQGALVHSSTSTSQFPNEETEHEELNIGWSASANT